MSRGSWPINSSRKPEDEIEHKGASRIAFETSGLECASPMPTRPSSVLTLMMRMVWQPSPIGFTAGRRTMTPSMSVIFIGGSTLPVGGEMCHAIAALDPAEMALAQDHAGCPEVAEHRLARRVVDEMHLAGELAGLDHVAELDRGLKQAGLGRIDVVVAVLHLDEAGRRCRRRRGCLRRLDDADMGQEVADAALDDGDAGPGHAAAAAELAAERHQAALDRRHRRQPEVRAVGPDHADRRGEGLERLHGAAG